MKAKAKAKIKQPARPSVQSRERRESVDAVVKAAYLDLMAAGVYPSVKRVCRLAGVGETLGGAARGRLIDSGSVPVPASPYVLWREVDDPFTEKPDAPDAAEVRARIEAIRAEKEAARVVEPIGVATARYHRPNSRPHSRQRIVA